MDLSREHLSENIWMIQWIRCLVYASRMEISWDCAIIAERNLKEYDEKYYERYKEILYETNVLYRKYEP